MLLWMARRFVLTSAYYMVLRSLNLALYTFKTLLSFFKKSYVFLLLFVFYYLFIYLTSRLPFSLPPLPPVPLLTPLFPPPVCKENKASALAHRSS